MDSSGTNPYLTYNFLVKWGDGPDPVAAVTSVSGLGHKTEAISFHAGEQPQGALKIPGQTDYEPVRLQRGITTDAAFETWASQMWATPNTETLASEADLASFRKDIQIELYDQSGRLALRYLLHNCWPSEYTAMPELDSEDNTVALASLTLEHEGWERG
jgi:phage tail-like protein